MENHNFPFPGDSFGNMQQNINQHLQSQQNIAGVPDAYTHGWSEVAEQFRIQNNTIGGPQRPQGAHQMSQQHQGMPQNMSLMGNQAMAAQMQRQTPRMPHAVMNTQNQYQQQQRPQQHQLQFNQNNMVGNMAINSNTSAVAAAAHLMQGGQNPPLFPPSTNINPGVALQLQKITNGIAPGQSQLQRPPAPSQNSLLHQSSANCGPFEQRMNTIQEQAKLTIQSGNIMQMRQTRDIAAEFQKKSNEDRELWMGIFHQLRANPANANAAKQVENWFGRYQKLYETSDNIVKSLEVAIQSAQQQQAQHSQQQQQQQHQNATNMMSGNFPNDGRVSATGMNSGMNTQQQWSGLQREAANQAAMHNQSSFGAPLQNRPTLNAMNYATNFTNPTNQQQQQQPATDFNSMQQNRAAGLNQIPIAQPDQSTAIKENFMKFLQSQNVESRIVVAGRTIDLWDLWHTVKKFDTTPGNPANHPAKFHMIGAQLGLPTEPANSQTWQYAKELQEHYNRISIALQIARGPQQRPNVIPTGNLAQAQAQVNHSTLQAAIKSYPHINFSGITPDMITKLPTPRFEASIRSCVAEQAQSANNPAAAANMPPRTPIPNPAMMTNPMTNPRIPTPGGNDSVSSGQIPRQVNIQHPLNTDEIMRLHEQCQTVWRRAYDTLQLPTYPMPTNVKLWKEKYTQAMQYMKPIIMGMGLYLHLRRDKDEMHAIIQKSVLLMKQRTLMGAHLLLTIQGLDEFIQFLEPRTREFQERLRTLGNLPPALYGLTKPSDSDFITLGGLLPPHASTPVHQGTPGPGPGGRVTPAPPVAVPTPPHPTGPQSGLQANMAAANLAAKRRGAFSEGNNMTSPASFQTSPAPVMPTSNSPAASSPPKTGKTTRPRAAQKRKPSKPINTPTSAAEPASTSTPATTAPTPTPAAVNVNHKRPFDDTEAQSSQPGPQPSVKRMKTEPSPPAMPPKPITPPPLISAPISRNDICTAEAAKELLAETFKKSEEQTAISQSQGQGSQDLDLETWLSQLVASSADPGPSTLFPDLGALVSLPNEAESQVDGTDIEFFDYSAYFDVDGVNVPELDQRPTLSPESHNDATTTPPSQANVPARPGAKATEQKAAGSGVPLATAVKVEEAQIGTMSESDYLTSFFENAGGFPYDGTVEQLDEPWAIQ